MKRHRWAWTRPSVAAEQWLGTCARCGVTVEVEEVGPKRHLRKRYFLPHSIESLRVKPPCEPKEKP